MIKIVFVSNYINHHEKFFCDEISKKPGVEFHFIQTMQMDEERVNLGWSIDINSLSYCTCSYGSNGEYEKALKSCSRADVLILGSAPYEFIAERVRENKLTFFYAERLFRNGLWHMLYPPTFFNVLKRFIIPGNKSNFYMLCASGYTALDCHKIHAFRGKYFRWGHFIEVKNFDSVDALLESKRLKHPQGVSILWVGRLIGLKHPEQAIQVAAKLKHQGYKFELNIIGTGEMEEALEQEVKEKDLTAIVHFLGVMKPQEVRSYMEDANIYLFTSDFNEGWGAVLGEAMASGCAVVTSHGIGATPFLVKHNENALIYENSNKESLFRNVKKLIESEELRTRLARNAVETMGNLWNANVGANRLYEVIKALKAGTDIPIYDYGPMSKAALLSNNWFKDDTV
ncbi:glycosyltransferase family 4 protein [Prevotella sp. P6B1]|uniref:glycosyltransferase family 4 protein n=1 Tax=Prevotella sp. P6B1 TaxID=1410613 RepID=UPI00051BC5A6|nr:glycosyltransferase family 4 protein [Prevotella sp. P6B1]